MTLFHSSIIQTKNIFGGEITGSVKYFPLQVEFDGVFSATGNRNVSHAVAVVVAAGDSEGCSSIDHVVSSRVVE